LIFFLPKISSSLASNAGKEGGPGARRFSFCFAAAAGGSGEGWEEEEEPFETLVEARRVAIGTGTGGKATDAMARGGEGERKRASC